MTYADWKDEDIKEKVSWNELKVGECFTGPGGMYRKNSEDEVFWFNAHTEVSVTKEENKNNKVFTRTEEDGDSK